jgi:hypothetical protein
MLEHFLDKIKKNIYARLFITVSILGIIIYFFINRFQFRRLFFNIFSITRKTADKKQLLKSCIFLVKSIG